MGSSQAYSKAYWARYRQTARPYVMRTCRACGAEFQPKGTQTKCAECSTVTCQTCGLRFRLRDGKASMKFCSRSCNAKQPATVERINRQRGRKPRSSLKRGRSWRGCAEDREWRDAVFKRDGYKCVMCGAGGRLEADHIEPVATNPEKRHEASNGRTLCVPCHKKTPTYGWRSYWVKVRSTRVQTLFSDGCGQEVEPR